MNLLEQYNKTQAVKLMEGKSFADFKSGDTLKVHVKIIEGTTERVQIFEGLCISRKNRGLGSTFIVRKICQGGEGAERIFQLYAPRIQKIEVVKYGKVRRAKLNYIKKLKGKAARIKAKTNYNQSNKISK